MNTAQKIRLAFIALLWLALCWLMLASRPFNFFTLFVVVASGIVVFVPLYKKYRKEKND